MKWGSWPLCIVQFHHFSILCQGFDNRSSLIFSQFNTHITHPSKPCARRSHFHFVAKHLRPPAFPPPPLPPCMRTDSGAPTPRCAEKGPRPETRGGLCQARIREISNLKLSFDSGHSGHRRREVCRAGPELHPRVGCSVQSF